MILFFFFFVREGNPTAELGRSQDRSPRHWHWVWHSGIEPGTGTGSGSGRLERNTAERKELEKIEFQTFDWGLGGHARASYKPSIVAYC